MSDADHRPARPPDPPIRTAFLVSVENDPTQRPKPIAVFHQRADAAAFEALFAACDPAGERLVIQELPIDPVRRA